ncbi:F-box only protein 10 isoform X2 [Denticeps clupeoides]|uniref:F-box only protein 10 isoform X2 n=1 Tax=Denticeps clupeoides TaxID=299321 RepID=UPI0010A3935E|nr:F-box only protein 10 isoform X2 [Denticeps clupeoides]
MEVGSLPVELWRLILAYLPLTDLGRCCQVCRAWRELVLSLDATRWRQLCLECRECRHPNWPRHPDQDPASWHEALRQHCLASRTWAQNVPELQSSACLTLFRRRKDRRVWRVGSGPGCEFETLRGALAVAGPYDRLALQPGLYEEQAEVALKVPVEIVGAGKLGDVALLVSFDQQCPTARLCNLVLMPAWFSPVVYKTSAGHIQLDNCNFEGAQLQVRGPGTCQVRFCSFTQGACAHFLGVALSWMDSCEFGSSDSTSITVEGPPVTERNWACKHLAALAKIIPVNNAAMATAEDSLSHNGMSGTPTGVSAGGTWATQDVDKDGRTRGGGGQSTVLEDGWSESETSEDEDGKGTMVKKSEPSYTLSYDAHGLSHLLGSGKYSAEEPMLRTLGEELQRDSEAQSLVAVLQGCVIRHCLLHDGKGGVHVCNYGHARLEANTFTRLHYAVRCIQNAKVVMLANEVSGCRASGVFMRLSAQGLIAENNIHSNAEAGLDIRKGANPIILCNRIHSGLRSGIVVLGNGKGSIRSNQIYGNKEAGVYILFSGNPVVSGNHIFQGQAAGIAVNENGRGLITGNMIRENQWGGADIRRGGDPILKNNFICHGFSDGVVVGERGRGLIEGNHIYGNKGCGVWVMSSSLPQLIGNYITHNRMYGLAVFCRKDPEVGAGREEGERGGGGGENLNEEGELLAWESDLDSEDERFSTRRPISVALVENNCMNHNGVGVYVKSCECVNVVGNMVGQNRGVGVAVLQSTQLTRLVDNCVHGNTHSGVTVERECRVELRGNGVYANGSHGVCYRGDGLIVENDIVGNRRSGVRVSDSADVKVLRNRVQAVLGCGISIHEQVRGLIQDNLVFQGHPCNSKPQIHLAPKNQDCLLINNTLLTHSNHRTGLPDLHWALENPPPRPHCNDPTASTHSAHPVNLALAVTTRITASVESGCHNNGSIFCSIL